MFRYSFPLGELGEEGWCRGLVSHDGSFCCVLYLQVGGGKYIGRWVLG